VSGVSGWGDNSNGQLGEGSTSGHRTPVEVKGLPPAAAVESGSGHVLALLADGTVRGWGRNAFGQVGDGGTENRTAPVEVRGLRGVRAVAPGGGHSLALLEDGTVWAWGAGFFGALGPATFGVQPVPVRVEGVERVVAIAAGGAHNLALDSDGRLWTWGRDDHGQLGDGPDPDATPGRIRREYMGRSFPCRPDPRPVANLGTVVRMAAGGGHNLAVLDDGSLAAWGYDDRGQLGIGGDTDQPSPVRVRVLSGVTRVAAAYHHSVAVREDGGVWAWGLNDGGQVGDGSTTHRSVPTRVAGVEGAVAVAANGGGTDVAPGNGGHCYALLASGEVLAWGWNDHSQLGDGSTANRLTPVPVQGLSGVRGITAGGEIPQFRENPGGGYGLALH
jgi:alpha-tubulin suppressor-like RCC1 family protein